MFQSVLFHCDFIKSYLGIPDLSTSQEQCSASLTGPSLGSKGSVGINTLAYLLIGNEEVSLTTLIPDL
jgi:hypothetical protein